MTAILDSGAMVAVAVTSDPAHTAMVAALAEEPERICLPQVALTEAAFVLRRMGGSNAVATLIRGLASSDWTLEPLLSEDLPRLAELLDQHADARPDFVDLACVTIAERMGARRIYTLDRRDFALVRPRHIDAFELLPRSP